MATSAAQAQFDYTTNAGTITITHYAGPGGVVTIPATINGLPVTSIGNYALSSNGPISLTIPASVTNIGEYAVEATSSTPGGLTSVYFQGNAPTADSTAFFNQPYATVYYVPGTTGWSSTFAGLPAVMLNQPFPSGCVVFSRPTDTISINGHTLVTNQITIEAEILISSALPAPTYSEARIFEEELSGQCDKQLWASLGIIGGGTWVGDNPNTLITVANPGANDVWHHLAFVHDSNEDRIYLDGLELGTLDFSGDPSIANSPDSGMSIGATGVYAPYVAGSFIGAIQWVRVSCVARYSGASVTPPVAVPSSDAFAQILFDFSQVGPGTSIVYDLSPNQFTGTVAVGFSGATAPSFVLPTPPLIITQPQSLAINAHESASFTVTASGDQPLGYQWLLNGTNISGATASSCTISNVTQTNLGAYAVFVTNAFGSETSSNATLSMYPFLAAPFGGLDTYWGNTNILSVEAWGSGPLSFQWYQNGVALPSATNETLTLTSIQFANAGLYSVVVTSPLGSVTNTPEQVVVNPAGVSLGLFPGVIIQGVVGYSYIIQSTTNLSNTNSWCTKTNVTLTQPIQLWVDTNTDTSLPGNPYRFYQVLPGQ